MNNKIWSQIKPTGNNHGFDLLLLSGITLGSLLLSPLGSYAAPFESTQTFLNPTPANNDAFGISVSTSDNNVLVGAVGASGSAYLFDTVTGNLQKTFLNPTPGNNELFGSSVSISGNNILVGAAGDNTGNTFSGATYLFDAVTGNLQRTFFSPTPAVFDRFGYSVSISGNNVLIGADWDDAGATDSGAAYLFNAVTGSLQKTFLNPTPANSDFFGFSVSISDNNVLIGAYGDNALGNNNGAAYLYDAVTGSLRKTFLNPTPSSDQDLFGFSVSVSGNNILIGAPRDGTAAPFSGAAYLFDAVTGSLRKTFLHPAPGFEDWFGLSTSISGDRILIGARGDDTGATYSGAAYLFDAVTGNLLQTFLNPTPANNDQFGFSVSVSGNNVLIGAFNDDTGATNAGAAYLFQPTQSSKTVPEPSNILGLGLIGLGLAATKMKGVLSKKAKSPTDDPQETDN
ncbi:MAG: PEP-CTERM sorting domain-containing protein [Microcystis aeruginosa SX13-11]|nr:PEP-CTERM sorting domain-containing protein [Microcystis aeruginosa SX13-11]